MNNGLLAMSRNSSHAEKAAIGPENLFKIYRKWAVFEVFGVRTLHFLRIELSGL